MSTPASLDALATRWAQAKPAERANAQSYLKELCRALGVEEPRPAGTGYEFEFPIKVVARDGTESTNFVDLYKANHFALEAKDDDGGKSKDMLLRKAFGQLRSYIGHLPHERPPYLLVLDVGRTLLVWDRWSGDYGGFNAARRIDLTTLADRPDDVGFLRDIWDNPAARDPRSKAVAVTQELAARLAELAADLERQGFGQERVARFLMRCVFTMFAEDVGLLDGEPFRHIIDDVALSNPAEFIPLAEDLWRAMDTGQRFLLKKLLRFNGHFFADAEALPLTREGLALLLAAASADWAHVEPTIFGTLLTRALDPEERHKLGAEYTPREYVERVVRPTVEEPIRQRWTLVQAEVLQLRESGKKKDLAAAEARLREFHDWLQGLQFLDPACGSGNFLYVTMHVVKRIEFEAIRLLEEVTARHELRMSEVGPWQFHGIEVKPWAREIAELTLWIGFHQFWKAHHAVQPPEPVLRDTGTLECRDAVLAWERIVPRPERAKPDPTPRITHAVTGELVPDPTATLPYDEYIGARPAPWPAADFIVGNPPYLGEKRQREVFGDGYVDALRSAYPEVPDSADFVLYWWYRAAEEVAAGRTIRAGLITTNTLVQSKNRVVIERAADKGAVVSWAVADHPWVEGDDGAAVRVAMTVIARNPQSALAVTVNDFAKVVRETRVSRLNADLSAHADVPRAAAVPLLANAGLASQGYKLVGEGFVLSPTAAEEMIAADPRNAEVIRLYRNGRDMSGRPRGVYVIDFGLRDEAEAMLYPMPFQRIYDTVKPGRDAVRDKGMRERWWIHGRPRGELREALVGLSRYIVTLEVSKHRFFTFLDRAVAPDGTLVAIASDDAYVLGVLSSSIHVTWALAAGGRMGVGNDPRYTMSLCFNAFPFPAVHLEHQCAIRQITEELEAFRQEALARDERVTITAMYNIVEKLRSGEALTESERTIHGIAACGLLRDLHDRLDAAVAAAYGWKWPMSREETLLHLVELHDARVAEEDAGHVQWVRPDFQQPRYGGSPAAPAPKLDLPAAEAKPPRGRPRTWPSTAIDQMSALQRLVAKSPVSLEEAVVRFKGARRELVQRHLETLALMGEMWVDDLGRYHAASLSAAAA
jgi:hypothetical protein